MGQYWRCYINPMTAPEIVLNPWDYNIGAKITEHSYILSDFVGDVCGMIHNNPCIIAWVGDYAEVDNRMLTKKLKDTVFPNGGGLALKKDPNAPQIKTGFD